MYELKGKTALVTGASKRIGKAIALGLASQGTNVIIHYRKSEAEAEKVRGEIAALGAKSWLIKADLSDLASCKRLMDQAYDRAGKIDILINNASIFPLNKMSKIDTESLEREMSTNAWAPFTLGILLSEKTREGRIINLLDTRIAGYDFNHFSYYLSKRMLEILTNSMALKQAPNITVNAVAPGLILPPEGKDLNYLESKKGEVPLKRYGSVSDVVDAVLFLLKSDYITGQVIFVDGGKHLIQTIEGLDA